ncbi:MAG: Vi polysaccharide biosynthesis UDP-N-acetylglucosamine C-6 dehydrogenase TviB [Gammaproteobacteria bacterium]|nr:Vi polysaccharide biosynthesis UDP-N-acetylglucosamine C-6 dehydrogenase TviB [Gammaproteobacteria bacterium]MBT8103997.1 Vi polysaccharide biosynthesis UDP-N-acetylglucosamine C-6 dehydrogenase TviB [Gammaproteobacteria bacterium]NNK24012.1 Vi polysaccharide biosynthesis UDP-N-acetylglucosamine C-6 dehydrogenase TviB [Woeseiaceae bacterium]NNL62802.1 Vi polysaccharide biosynthesis UDP-N-acetylglucosamine C-6 dehydrogenase TviB [Woeseiaceae bacterium]
MSFDINNLKIGVIGLGYVGLPLGVEFGKHYPTVGFDINAARVAELEDGSDSTLECSDEELAAATHLEYTTDVEAIRDCNVYIVTVPTPIGDGRRPLLTPLRAASTTLGKVLKKGDIVVYESTVYPGCTEEFCVPLLEEGSGLTMNEDFYVGYSPERINPGDKEHRLPTILKVTSGSTPEAATFIDEVYATIITAGTHKASSIKVAEAAKVIENTQRDVNIALVNELAMIFERVDIDTEEVLEAAGTKWNFLPFRPGLVGGHCIGVDPYYLTYKAEQLGYHPQMILAGRRINDNMAVYVASRVIKAMTAKGVRPSEAKILVLGLTFKENCPDVRNTKIVDIVAELASWGGSVDVHDPWVDTAEAKEEYGIDLVAEPEKGAYDGVVIAVAHDCFRELGEAGIKAFGKDTSVLYDIKYVLPANSVDDRL